MAQSKERLKNPDVEAANEIYKTARAHADVEMAKLRDEVDVIKEEHEALGAIRKIKYDASHNEMLKFAILHKIKQKKEYRKGGMTWEQFCDAIGEDRRRVAEVLEDLRPIYNNFSADFGAFLGVPLNKIRYLGRNLPPESGGFEDGTILIDRQKIPITPENRDEIEAAIDAMKDAHRKQIDDQAATIRAKDKVLKDKETLLNKQAKEIAKLEGHAAEVGYTPAEEKLMQKMDNARTIIDGFLMDFDPERRPLPEDASPRMRAKLMHTLDYFRRVILGAFDTAADYYGIPEIDDDWVPPHLRKKEDAPDMASGEE